MCQILFQTIYSGPGEKKGASRPELCRTGVQDRSYAGNAKSHGRIPTAEDWMKVKHYLSIKVPGSVRFALLVNLKKSIGLDEYGRRVQTLRTMAQVWPPELVEEMAELAMDAGAYNLSALKKEPTARKHPVVGTYQ